MDLSFIHAFHLHRHAKPKKVAHNEEEVYQISTIAALVEGIYEGAVTFGELANHGDLGLGTLNALDGEMIALGGKFYQINTKGEVRAIDPEEKTPFAVMVFFRPQQSLEVSEPMDWHTFQQKMNAKVSSVNLFYAFRVHGKFSKIKLRSVPRQNKPYHGLDEVAKTQTIFDLENVTGTLVGFRFPTYTQALNVSGYHVHFITDERDAGGHVLDFAMESGKIEIDSLSEFRMELPHGGDFLKADLPTDPSAAVRSAET